MRASFPSFSSRLLAAIGTGALLVLIVISITGGFVLQVALPFFCTSVERISLIAAVAWLAAALHGARAFDAGANITTFSSAMRRRSRPPGRGTGCGRHRARTTRRRARMRPAMSARHTAGV